MSFNRLLAIITAAACLVAPATAKDNILSLKRSITDSEIVPPESYETDTQKMMHNWYLRNYVEIDDDLIVKGSGKTSDAEYIKRLQALPTVIEMPFNNIVKQYIELYVNKKPRLVEQMLGMSHYYMPIFEQALEKEGLPIELKYLPVIESAMDPSATSRVGAAGLWQFMVGTGEGLGLRFDSRVDERREPFKSSEAAARYLKDLHSIYNDWSLAIAAYNCGPGNVNKALKRAGGGDFWDIYYYLPKETRGYVPCFIAACYVMNYYGKHGIKPALMKKPLVVDTLHINKDVHFDQICHVLDIPIEELQVLNPQYRTNMIPGNSYACTLILPSQQVGSYIMREDSILAYNASRYNHRPTVEPGGSTKSDDEDDVEYTWRTETKTAKHHVRRGETLGTIAKSYAMTQQQLINMNPALKRNKKVRRGQVLSVVTTKRVKVPVPKQPSQADGERDNERDDAQETAQAALTEQEQYNEVQEVRRQAQENARRGSYHVNVDGDDDDDDNKTATRNEGKTAQTTKAKNKNKTTVQPVERKPRTTTHTVKRGESLGALANKYGVSIADIKKANGIKRDVITPGQRLKIPTKGGASGNVKSGKARKTSAKSTGRSRSGKSKSTKRRRR